MDHEHDQHRKRSRTAATTHHVTAVPGRSSRSAALYEPAHPAASGLVQRRASAAGEAEPSAVQAAAARGIATTASPLPRGETIQRLFGRHDISAVQAHTGPDAAASARAMGAEAYATGNHVVLGAGADLHTVAHEAAHVVQQAGGVQLEGGVGQVGDAYERHADAVADLVVQGKSAESLLDAFASGASTGTAPGGAVQFARKGFALYGTDGAPAESERQHYKDPEQRKAYVLKIEGGNVSYQTTAEDDEQRNQWSGSARVQYVFTPSNVFYGQYYGPGVPEGPHDFHTRYTAAANVTCGGWMEVNGHTLTKIGNDSGHYKPEMEGLYRMLTVLHAKGVDMGNLAVLYVTPENTRQESTAAEFLATHQEGFDAAQAEHDKLTAFKVSNISFDKFGPTKGGSSEAKKGGKYDHMF